MHPFFKLCVYVQMGSAMLVQQHHMLRFMVILQHSHSPLHLFHAQHKAVDHVCCPCNCRVTMLFALQRDSAFRTWLRRLYLPWLLQLGIFVYVGVSWRRWKEVLFTSRLCLLSCMSCVDIPYVYIFHGMHQL